MMPLSHQSAASAIAARNRPAFGHFPSRPGRPIGSRIAELWVRMVRNREQRRMRKAWATMDSRTLEDIGVSRLEIAYAGVAQETRSVR
jgi:uncharacterized protein YjiS (DUF1127 family)